MTRDRVADVDTTYIISYTIVCHFLHEVYHDHLEEELGVYVWLIFPFRNYSIKCKHFVALLYF